MTNISDSKYINRWINDLETNQQVIIKRRPIIERHLLKELKDSLTFQQLQILLTHLMKKSVLTIPPCSFLFEEYIAQYFFRQTTLWSTWKCSEINRNLVPYEDMKEGILYYPKNASFPFVEMYFKKDHLVYGVQVSITKGLKECSVEAINIFLKNFKYPNDLTSLLHFKLIYCRLYETSTWTIKRKIVPTR